MSKSVNQLSVERLLLPPDELHARGSVRNLDRLDYTKGISKRMKGYELFLKENPGYHGRVVFALVVVPSRDNIVKYAERKQIIDEAVGNLNSGSGNISWQPVLYNYGHLSFEELVGLYTACDLALITPLRDGMNLVSKEFVASRKDRQGVLVLSVMAEGIRNGLEMSREDQEERMSAMDTVSRFELLDKYSVAGKRLLLLDYDGTLIPFSRLPSLASPGKDMLEILNRIAENPRNVVYIVSGRDSQTLENWFSHLPIGLISEHGGKIRHRDGTWETEVFSNPQEWMGKIEGIMEQYISRCPHTFVERKDFSIAWHYRNADINEGMIRARELYEALQVVASAMHLNVLNGNKVIEVRTKGINKGVAIGKVLDASVFDFILCIGDDETDEDMFKKLAVHREAFTIKVGNEASFAKYNLYNPGMVQSLLHTISLYALKN